MKWTTLRTTLTNGSLALLLAASVLPAEEHHRCTNRGAAGDWGYTATGTRVGVGPVAAVGTFTIAEDGTIVNGHQTVSFNGFIADETYSGTYILNEDCTGTTILNVTSPILNRTSHVSFVDVDDINEARMIFADAGTVITLEAKRISARRD